MTINTDALYFSNKKSYQTPFHIVTQSPWPFLVSISALSVAINLISYLHYYHYGFFKIIISLIFFLIFTSRWFSDIIIESTFEGHHTKSVQKNIHSSMALFIVSEFWFFVAFFWALFHSCLSVSVGIGYVWPPKGIQCFDTWSLPFFNTIILLSSGVSITWSHKSIISKHFNTAYQSLLLTTFLGFFFLIFQAVEYTFASFSMNDGIYGSLFFICTGFHGFHGVLYNFTFKYIYLTWKL